MSGSKTVKKRGSNDLRKGLVKKAQIEVISSRKEFVDDTNNCIKYDCLSASNEREFYHPPS